MQRTTLILERTAALRETFGIEASWWSSAFVADLQALVTRITGTTATITTTVRITAEIIDQPFVIISGDTPHIPETRIRDAFTLLESGIDVVVGPCDRGSWYILGIRQPGLAAHIPLAAGGLLPWIDQIQRRGLHVIQLPLWFRVMYPTDLATLAMALRTMPAGYASATRHLLSDNEGSLAREWGA
ncbi:MAG: DUF2064 domain-containing protein [Chloroflexus sp.]|nr:DUF2064 domain-containing protein [Chloroflexus sp.]MCX7858999.1 DUF2064 domain-containing protein [Chloroflexus sp.]